MSVIVFFNWKQDCSLRTLPWVEPFCLHDPYSLATRNSVRFVPHCSFQTVSLFYLHQKQANKKIPRSWKPVPYGSTTYFLEAAIRQHLVLSLALNHYTCWHSQSLQRSCGRTRWCTDLSFLNFSPKRILSSTPLQPHIPFTDPGSFDYCLQNIYVKYCTVSTIIQTSPHLL